MMLLQCCRRISCRKVPLTCPSNRNLTQVLALPGFRDDQLASLVTEKRQNVQKEEVFKFVEAEQRDVLIPRHFS